MQRWGLGILGIVAAMIIAKGLGQRPFCFADDFSRYPFGSFGEPNWEVNHIGFEIRNGMMRAEVPEGRGYAILQIAPLAQALIVEATLIVHRSISREWKIAGIGIYLDDRNYWHLALVEAPDNQDKRHFAELSEMLDGVWNAHGEPVTRLTTEEDTGGFVWEYGRRYRLRVTLTKERIIGEIFELDGALLYRCVRRFDNKAVTVGRPMLDCGGFIASFDNMSVEVKEVAPEPPKRKTYLPFITRHSPLVTRRSATGFFRTERINGVWWLIDPNGNATLSIGTDHVSYYVHWCEKLGYAPYHRNVAKKYGSEEAWAKEAVRRLVSWNFNVLGANNSSKARYQGLAHTEFLSFGADFSSVADIVPKVHWTGFPDVFDQRFERFCDLRAKERCAPNKDDPWLLGYFLDNELEWWGKSHRLWGIAEEAWKKPPDRPCKKALVQILCEFYRNDINAFNADFGTNFARFGDMLASQEPTQPRTERGQKALMAFVREAAERYFAITTKAVRKHDKNHLILGNRFAWDAPDAAWEMAGKYCEVVTVNLYPRIDLERGVVLGVEEHLRKRFELCQKPIIVTEWSFPALDAKDSEGKPLPCKHGAGMRVDTQEQKARCYAIFQRTIFTLPFIVGSHYFMWVDEPALGISSTFPEDSNYGLVNEADEPYQELTAIATKVNLQMFALHAGMTAELSAQVKNNRIIVRNDGRVAATFTLAKWLNGVRADERITLQPKAVRFIPTPATRHSSLSTYLRVVCDPDDEMPEGDKSDNTADLILRPQLPPPLLVGKGGVGGKPIAIAIVNPTPHALRQVPVTIADRRLTDFINRIGSDGVAVQQVVGSKARSESGVPSKRHSANASWLTTNLTDVPFQLHREPKGNWVLSVLVPDLPPFSTATLWIGQGTPKTWRSPLTFGRTRKGYEIATGTLGLVKDEPDGDAFDRIYLDKGQSAKGKEWVELGSFTPLIFQVVAGQNLWVRPDKVEAVEVREEGLARLVVDIVFAFGKGSGTGERGSVITEVGKGGEFAPLKAEPQPFRCAYRFTFFPNQPFFLAQCLWVENAGKRAWQWRGYYHYTLSNIGGEARDDEVGGAGVPNYWLFFASWRDPKLRLHYGVIPLQEDERLGIYFWIDEGGGQHPDCHRRLEGELKPSERFQPKEPEPVVAVFGVRETDGSLRPWSALVQTLRSWAKVQAKVF